MWMQHFLWSLKVCTCVTVQLRLNPDMKHLNDEAALWWRAQVAAIIPSERGQHTVTEYAETDSLGMTAKRSFSAG